MSFANQSVTGLNVGNHYQWTFGDGTSSDDFDPNHTYTTSGTYTVCLLVWNNETNCEDQVCHTVTIALTPTPCEAAFTFTVDGGVVAFANQSVTGLNAGNHYQWTLGDGTSSDGANPTHTYTTSGTYTVCLLVWNNETNCEDQVCHTVTIALTPTPCEAAFTFTVDGGVVAFANQSVTSLNAGNHYQWTFGDGTNSDDFDPNHTYTTSGTYTVCLLVWNNETNCEDQVCHTVTIALTPTPCEAAFTFTVDGGVVVFANQSVTGLNVGNHYQWTFGDGTSSDGFDPNHTYTASGTYTVCLLVWNNETNCEDQVCHTVTIALTPTPCEAAFTFTVDGGVVAFANQSVTGLNAGNHYQWTFGDGTNSDGVNPNHTYTTSGTYTVCLLVWNNETNCEDQVCHTVTIALTPTPCEAAFTFTVDGGVVSFANQSVTGLNVGNHYQWTFGDGTSSDDFDPNHTYTTSGTYTVCLLVWNNETNCEDHVCHTVTIELAPVATCEANYVFETDGLVAFFNSSTSSTSLGDIVHYVWTFGDGTQSDNPNPIHTFTETGIYEVCLTITSNTDCSDTYCTSVVVEGQPVNDLRINPNYVNNGSVNAVLMLLNSQTVHVSLLNPLGQDVLNATQSFEAGYNNLQLDTDVLPAGVYWLSIQFNNGFTMTQNLVKF
ncbi:MAG: PKD domain-containing protein [Sphingobacteriales bacterium]|nr:PKD domain-containing protein [Sphingobacteriales bacterium]